MAQLWQVCFVLLAAMAGPARSDDFWWQDLRGGMVRDRLYLEGGLVGGVINVEGAGSVTTIKGGAGNITFSLATPFNATTNFTQLFTTSNDTTESGVKPHANGYMFVDDDEFYAFGGRAVLQADTHSSWTEIRRGAIFQPNAQATGAELGVDLVPNYIPTTGNSTSNNYITNGAGVSVPSESLGFYFGGLRAQNSSAEINYNAPSSGAQFPSVLSNTMLRVDTSLFGESSWSQTPLPASVPSRADAVLAWVPVGAQGALVVIGGVPFPASVFNYGKGCDISQNSTQAANNSIAASLMTSLSIYDIATGAWYNQNTTGATPPQLAQACAVVAYPDDRSVINVYVHGGFDGVSSNAAASDVVWVLSMPSFTWVKANSGTSGSGRYAHLCVKPYPNQMMVVGGADRCSTQLNDAPFANVFNLNTLQWQGNYDPAIWANYTVNTVISSAISTSTAAMDPNLASLFGTRYPRTPTFWGPYNTSSSVPTTGHSGGSSHNKWLIPVVVVIAVLAAVAASITLWRCLVGGKGGASSQSGRSRRSILAWRHGHAHTKSEISDGEMTQVESTIYEADGYFKRRPQIYAAELLAPDSSAASPLDSPFHSPRAPISPSSPSSELDTPPIAYELPVELPGNFVASNIKSHPMFPPNISGNTSSVQSPRSVSSPSIDPITPYELPHKRSNEEMLEAPPNDMLLDESNMTGKAMKSPRITASQLAGDPVSPSLSAVTASPNQGPRHIPVTPPTRPVDTQANRTIHTRNTSSLSSGLPDLSSPSPREDIRRSATIAALPEPPGTAAVVNPTVASSAEASSDADPNPASPQRREANIDKPIRRREVGNFTPMRSAYHENADMYGGGRNTV